MRMSINHGILKYQWGINKYRSTNPPHAQLLSLLPASLCCFPHVPCGPWCSRHLQNCRQNAADLCLSWTFKSVSTIHQEILFPNKSRHHHKQLIAPSCPISNHHATLMGPYSTGQEPSWGHFCSLFDWWINRSYTTNGVKSTKMLDDPMRNLICMSMCFSENRTPQESHGPITGRPVRIHHQSLCHPRAHRVSGAIGRRWTLGTKRCGMRSVTWGKCIWMKEGQLYHLYPFVGSRVW